LFEGRIKVMSTTALHSTLNISETVRDRDLVLKDPTTNRKWPSGYQVASCDPERSWPQYA